MATNWGKFWADLNARQRHYLRAVYDIDQERETIEKQQWRRGARSRPAEEWRWINYYPLGRETTSLLQMALGPDAIDRGTGATFEALERRGYVRCRHAPAAMDGEIDLLFVQITPRGRRLVRSTDPTYIPVTHLKKGHLRQSHWRALHDLYQAGPRGLRYDPSTGRYGMLERAIWLRLLEHQPPLVEERQQRRTGPVSDHQATIWDDYLAISASGREHYEAYAADYAVLYGV